MSHWCFWIGTRSPISCVKNVQHCIPRPRPFQSSWKIPRYIESVLYMVLLELSVSYKYIRYHSNTHSNLQGMCAPTIRWQNVSHRQWYIAPIYFLLEKNPWPFGNRAGIMGNFSTLALIISDGRKWSSEHILQISLANLFIHGWSFLLWACYIPDDNPGCRIHNTGQRPLLWTPRNLPEPKQLMIVDNFNFFPSYVVRSYNM